MNVSVTQPMHETPIPPVSGLPEMYHFSEELATLHPSHALFLGRSADGPLTREFPTHGHIAVTGPTDTGKSTILRMLLAQFLARNVVCYLCDEYYVPYNQMNGLDWTPIEMRLALPPRRTSKEITAFLRWLAEDELEMRKERAYFGQFVGQPLVVVIENVAGLVSESVEIASSISILLQQSLKYGIVLVLSSQHLHTSSARLSKMTLEQIGTGFFCGGDLRTAQLVLGFQPEQIDQKKIGTGIVYVRTRGLPATLARIPWPDNTSVQMLCESSNLPLHEVVRMPEMHEEEQPIHVLSEDVMNETTYIAEILRTYVGSDHMQAKMNLAALGLAGETGEIVDAIKKVLFQGHEVDVDAMEEELGDVLWYFMLLCNALGLTLDQVMCRNVRKLRARYPNGFESHRSVNRDATGEEETR